MLGDIGADAEADAVNAGVPDPSPGTLGPHAATNVTVDAINASKYHLRISPPRRRDGPLTAQKCGGSQEWILPGAAADRQETETVMLLLD